MAIPGVLESFSGLPAAVRFHHERWDGRGYPAGLRGEQIPLIARAVCIADAFEAMTTSRPYRRPVSVGDALAELELGSGTQFDPDLAKLFVAGISGISSCLICLTNLDNSHSCRPREYSPPPTHSGWEG